MRKKKVLVTVVLVWVIAFLCMGVIKTIFDWVSKPKSTSTNDNITCALPNDHDDNEYTCPTDGPIDNSGIENTSTSLFDCFAISNDWETLGSFDNNVTDARGNEYTSAYIFFRNDNVFSSKKENDSANSITVALDSNYKSLSVHNMFTLKSNNRSKSHLEFYSYNEETNKKRLISISPELKKGSAPKSFELDVTGVNNLVIVTTGTIGVESAELLC